MTIGGHWFSVLLVVITCPSIGMALEYFPEFESLTEEEQASFEGPSSMTSETQSDVLTYMKPEAWEYQWLSRSNGFDMSVGSLDGTHFLMDNRLKLRSTLNDLMEFRFTYFDDRDFEKQSVHHMLEIIAWPLEKIGLSAYGEPDYFKRKNDTGIAILIQPTPRHEIRLFNTFVDVTLLKRSDRNDTFIEPDLPYSRGLVGRLWSSPESAEKEFLEYAFRIETKTRWLFRDQDYVYEYDKKHGSVFFSKLLSSTLRLNGRVQFDRKHESRERNSAASTITPQNWTTDRLISFLRLVASDIGPRGEWELTGGLMAAYRWWDTESGLATYRDWLPHVALSLPGYRTASRTDRWFIGFLATQHRSGGAPALFSPNEQSSVTQYRFNLTYEFRFSDKAIMRLLATGDLDEYGTPGSWEGGNAQMSLLF